MVHAEAKAQGTLKPELVSEEFPLIFNVPFKIYDIVRIFLFFVKFAT